MTSAPPASISARSRGPSRATDDGRTRGASSSIGGGSGASTSPRAIASSLSDASPVEERSGGQASSWPSSITRPGSSSTSRSAASAPSRTGQSPPTRRARRPCAASSRTRCAVAATRCASAGSFNRPLAPRRPSGGSSSRSPPSTTPYGASCSASPSLRSTLIARAIPPGRAADVYGTPTSSHTLAVTQPPAASRARGVSDGSRRRRARPPRSPSPSAHRSRGRTTTWTCTRSSS